MRFLITLVFLCLTVPAGADIYKRIADDGTVTFEDKPHPDAVKLKDLGEIQTYKAPVVPPSTTTKKRKADAAGRKGYDRVHIVKPANEATIRLNEGSLSVTAVVSPQLKVKRGHTAALFLDGKMVSKPGASTEFSVSDVERGAHVLQVKVFDAKRKTVAQSDTVTVHLRRQSVLFHNRILGPPPRQRFP